MNDTINIFCIRPKGFNIGNDVIFLGMKLLIERAFGGVVNLIPLPATSRYESQAKAGLTARTIYEINLYGHGVIVGGGNLYENGELEVNTDALQTLEVPMMLFSLSRGRIYNRQHQLVTRTDTMPDRTLRALNEKASYSLARDKATCEYLHSLGCDKVELGGCPTILIDQLQDRLPELTEQDRSAVLLSVRNPSLMSVPLADQLEVNNDIIRIIQFLRSVGHDNIRILCHDHRDIAFAASLPNVDYVYTDDVFTYLAMLQSCRLNITYRLHSFIPCLALGTPAIKISYDERALSLVDTIGYHDWNINMVEVDDVVETVIERYHKLDSLKDIHTDAQPTWNALQGTMADAFQQFADDVLATAK